MLSKSNLSDKNSSNYVQVLPINNYKPDFGVLFMEMAMAPASAQRSTIAGLKRANAYIQFRPSIFGIGINLNEMIKDFIAALEKRLPPAPPQAVRKS